MLPFGNLTPHLENRRGSDTPSPASSRRHSGVTGNNSAVGAAALGALNSRGTSDAKPAPFSTGFASFNFVQKYGTLYVLNVDERKLQENYNFIQAHLADVGPLLTALPAICNWAGESVAVTLGLSNKAAKKNLNRYLHSLFLTALSNIIKSTQKAVYTKNFITPVPGVVITTANPIPLTPESIKITPIDILVHLLSIVSKHAKLISVNMKTAEGIDDPKRKDMQQANAFKALSDELVALAFPNGKKDLHLSAKADEVWAVVNDPSKFVSIYQLLIGTGTDVSAELDRTPSGKTISILSKFLAQQFIVKAPLICQSKAKMVGEQAAQIFASKITASPEYAQNISVLVSEFLNVIGNSKNQNIIDLWAFLGHRVSAVFSKSLFNIATNNNRQQLGNDPLSDVFSKLLPAFAKFFEEQGSRLKNEYGQIAANDAQQVKEAHEKYREEDEKVAADALLPRKMWADQVFGELAREILNATGIANELPPLFSHFGLDENNVGGELPNWLFSIYGILIADNPNLVDWLSPKNATAAVKAELDATSLSGVGSLLSHGIVKKVLEIAPQQADDATLGQIADIVLDQIALKIPLYANAEPQTKAWLKTWIINNIKVVFSNHPHATHFQQFIGDHLEGILASIFLHVAIDHQAPANPLAPNPAPVPATPKIGLADCFFKFATAAQTFATQNRAQIDAAIAAYEGMPNVTTTEKEAKSKAHVDLVALFQPLSNTLIDLLGLDTIRKLAVFDMDAKLKQEMLPKVLLNLYQQMEKPKQGTAVTYENLCRLLFDQDHYLRDPNKDVNVAATIINNLPVNLTQAERDALWIDSGSKAMADEALRFTGVAAKIITTQTQSFLKRYHVTELLNDLFGLGIPGGSPEANLLRAEVEKFADGHMAGSKKIWDAGQYLIEMALPKLLINIVESTEEAKRLAAAGGPPPQPTTKHRLDKMPTDIIVRIIKMLGNRLQGIEQHVKNIQASQATPQEKKEQIRILFVPFVQEFVNIAGDNVADATHPLHDLPGSIELKRKVWENLIPSILTDLMVSSFGDIHSIDLEAEQKEMRQIYGSNHVQSLSHLLAEFGKAYTPFLMSSQSAQLMGAVTTWTNFLHAHNVNIDDLIQSNIRKIGVKRDLAPGWDFLSATLEPFILKFIGGLSTTFNKIERNTSGGHNPDFLMDVTQLSMERIDDHITTLNLITKARKKSHPHQVSVQQMIIDFPRHPTGHLHAAMIDPIAKEAWIKTLVENLLFLADIDANAMPVPAPLRSEMFNLLKNELGPRVVKSMLEEMGKEHTQNGVKLSIIANLQRACNALMQQPVAAGQVRVLQPAQQQKVDNFKTAAGNIFGQVVRSIPNTLLNALQNVSSLKNKTNDELGNLVYQQINMWPMTRIMKEMIESTLPQLHPGNWQGDAFHPATRTRANGVDVLAPIADLNFTFPPTAQELQWQAERVQQTAQDFINRSNTLANTGIDTTVEMKAKELSDKLEQGINAIIQFVFRNYAPPVQRLAKECLTFAAKIIGVVIFPIKSVLHMIQEFHVSRQVQHLNKNFSHPINENLMYQLVDVFIDNAKARKQQMAAQAAAAAVPATPVAAVPVAALPPTPPVTPVAAS